MNERMSDSIDVYITQYMVVFDNNFLIFKINNSYKNKVLRKLKVQMKYI